MNIDRFPLIGFLGLLSCKILIVNLASDAILLGAIATVTRAIPYWLQKIKQPDQGEGIQ